MHAIERTAALPSLHLQVSRQQQRRIEAKKRGFALSRFPVANRVILQLIAPISMLCLTATTTLQFFPWRDGSWCWISRPGPDKNVFVSDLPRVSFDLAIKKTHTAAVNWFCSKAIVDPPPRIRMKAGVVLYVSSNPCEADCLQSHSSSCHESCFSFPSKS
jgi:hypothetical protein